MCYKSLRACKGSMGGLMGTGTGRGLAAILSPCSPLTYVFLSLLAIVLCFATIPNISTEVNWVLLVVFAVLALSPDHATEE